LVFSLVPAAPASAVWAGFVDLSGDPGGYIETLDTASLDITGDLDVRVLLHLDEPSVVNWEGLLSKGNSGDLSYASWGWFKTISGSDPSRALFEWRTASGTRLTRTSLTGYFVAGPRWYRVTLDVNNGSGGHTVKFWYSDDPVSTDPAAVSWTQHSSHNGSGVTSVRASGADVWLGDMPVQDDPLDGQVYYAEIRNGISGTVVANPDFRDTDQLISTDPDFGLWEDDFGNRWTIYPRTVEPSVGYVGLNETVGNYISAPDANPLDVTGDFDLRMLVEFAEPHVIQWEGLASKGNSGGQSTASWGFFKRFIAADPYTAQFEWRNSSGTRLVRVSDTSYIHPGMRWYRVTLDVNNGAGGHTVSFWYSDDPPETDPASVTWTLKNQVTSSGTTNIRNSTAAMWLGDMPSQGDPLNGRVFYAELRNGIDGTVVANPDFRDTDQLTSTPPNYSSWQDTHGNPWTITGTGWTYTPPDETPPQVTLDYPAEDAIVFHTETLTATATDDQGIDRVEFLIDDQVIATDTQAPYEAAWDTTTVTDGAYVITARAVDTADNHGDDEAAVAVGNALDAAARLAADFDAEVLTVDEYVDLGLTDLLNSDLLPSRYSGVEVLDGEGQGLVTRYLDLWGELTTPTQERLGAALEAARLLDFAYVDYLLEDEGEGVSALGGSEGNGLLSWSECEVYPSGRVGTYTRCTHLTEHFSIVYVPFGISSKHGVQEVDVKQRIGTDVVQCDPGSCNSVPDYIDQVAAALEHAWIVYDDLGFTMPQTLASVSIRAGRAHVLPTSLELFGEPVSLWDPTIVVNNSNDHFSTPRHELFHLIQYEYVALDQIAGQIGVWAWLEATAEWAAHQSSRSTDNVGYTGNEVDSSYFDRIGAVLSRPNWWALAFEDSASLLNPYRTQQRQYGMFVLAEHLEENLNQPDPETTVIERTWELIGAGASAPSAIEQVVDEHGPADWDLADELADFHVDNFVLVDQSGFGYSDSDAAAWRNRLSPALENSSILNLPGFRPLAVLHNFDSVGEAWDPTMEERPFVVAGGSVYAEMDLLDEDDNPIDGDLIVSAPAIADLAYSIVLFDGHPTICAAQPLEARVDEGPGMAGTLRVPLLELCDSAVLVMSHTGLVPGLFGGLEPGFLGNGTRVDWSASIAPSGNLLVNPSFEMGDLTGWNQFEWEPPPPAVPDPTQITVENSVNAHDGQFVARFETAGIGPDGLSQTVAIDPGDYVAGVWLRDVAAPQDFVVEVYDSEDQLIAEESYEFPPNPSNSWHEIVVHFSTESPEVTIRLTYVEFFSEHAEFLLDSASLSPVAP
jgi:hypothetical protein